MKLTVKTGAKREIVDITEDIQQKLPPGSGIAALNLLHTTCALTTADLDPGTDKDFLDFLQAITPNIKWRHPHDPSHAPDHLLSTLIGTSLSLSFEKGQLQLGQWQRVILVELDGPRSRNLDLSIIKAG